MWNSYYPHIMHILIFPSKIWTKKYTLYTAKYGRSKEHRNIIFTPGNSEEH